MIYNLEISQLSKKYSEFELNNISFSLPKGSIMGLIGRNGSGKTTIIKSLLNLIKYDSGNIKLFGTDIATLNKNIKNDIGVVFDEINFHENLTPKKISYIMSKVYSAWDTPLYTKYLFQFQLPTNKKIKEFSKGMKMKLSLAVALSHHPKLLILDEPTSGLDPIVRNEILDIFLKFTQNKENSILISSHITSDLEKIADYITFIDNGDLIFTNNKNFIINNYCIVECSKEDFLK
ncbi:TPA: ABC transporter ATP-binding protein, partial [Clostridium perfringens]|nr:ABC transporter ATP-binding protein [Clostridium perfringens]